MSEILEIPLASIRLGGGNHRLPRPGDEEGIKSLARSLSRDGLLQPVGVAGSGSAGYELVFGFRRLAAATLLGWTSIRAHVLFFSGNIENARAVENLMRCELNPVEEAVAVARLVAAKGNVAAVAADVGRSEIWVRNRIYLERLGPAVRQRLIDGKLLLGHAREIAKLADHDQQETLADWFKTDDDGICSWNLNQVRAEVAIRCRSLKTVAWELAVPFAKKPPCNGCPNNSANDHPLFGSEEHLQKDGYCLSKNCFDAKAAHAQKIMAKVVNRAVNQDLAANAKAVRKAVPEFLKASRVAAKVRKARGETVEREAPPARMPASAVNDHDSDRDAELRFRKAMLQWREQTAAAIEKAALAQPLRLAALMLANCTSGGRRVSGYGATPEALRELIEGDEGRSMLACLRQADDSALETLAGMIGAENNFPYIPLLWESSPLLVEQIALGWDVKLAPKPQLGPPWRERFPNLAKVIDIFVADYVAGKDGRQPMSLRLVGDRAVWWFRFKGQSGWTSDNHRTNSVYDAASGRFLGTGAENYNVHDGDLLEAFQLPPHGARERAPAPASDDDLESLGLADPLAAKLRRHGLGCVADIERAGGDHLLGLADLEPESDRFGPKEINVIRKAIGKREKKLAAQVVVPAANVPNENH